MSLGKNMSLFLYLTRSNPVKHITHISLAAHVVAARHLALALWRAHSTVKRAQRPIRVASANHVLILLPMAQVLSMSSNSMQQPMVWSMMRATFAIKHSSHQFRASTRFTSSMRHISLDRVLQTPCSKLLKNRLLTLFLSLLQQNPKS